MAKLFAALENEEVVVNNDNTLEEDLLEQEISSKEIGEEVQQRSDAIETSEVLEKMEAAETPEEAAKIATEHLLAKIGYTKKFSMESFSKDLDTGLTISQEGFFSRLGNAVKRTFTSDAKFAKKLEAALDKLKTNGSKEDVIKDPGWSKYLITKNDTLITGNDVVAFVKHLDSLVNEKDIMAMFKHIASVYEEIAHELNKNSFFSSKDVEKEIDSIIKKNNDLIKKHLEYSKKFNLEKIKDNYPDYEPIEYNNAVKIADIIEKNFAGNAAADAWEVYNKGADALNSVLTSRSSTNVVGHVTGALTKGGVQFNPADVKLTLSLVHKVDTVVWSLINLQTTNARTAYAVLRYIEASSK